MSNHEEVLFWSVADRGGAYAWELGRPNPISGYFCATNPFVGVLASSGGQSQILYDDEHGAIVITAPQGWTFEHKTNPEEGLRAVVHPIGMTAPKASSVMYVRTAQRIAR